MSCQVCGDLGMLVQEWTDAPHDFAICLCPAAAWYRSDVNASKRTGYFGWQLWCAREQVDPARVFKLEDIYTRQELAEVGLFVAETARAIAREAALLAAGRTRRTKL